MAAVVLLGAVVAGILFGHRRVRPSAVAVGGVAVGLVAGVAHVDPALDAVRPLHAPLAFLVAAVPVAVLLDRVGLFTAAAEWVVARPFARGPRLTGCLWVFAALVVVVFNLDAAIVLLTPLYLRIARLYGLDPVRVAFQPVLLASLASSVLPVSNLTNLIVAEHWRADVGDFLRLAAPASLAATVVGWWAYRSSAGWVPTGVPGAALAVPVADPVGAADPDAWRIGGPAVLALLAGFTVGDAVGVPAWLVAAAVATGLCVATRHVPWRAVPVDAVAVAAGLAVLAAAAAPHLGLDGLLAGSGPADRLRAFGTGVLTANTVNNLPALLVGLPNLSTGTAWAYLTAVNIGPVLWISGSLAGLLWADIMARHGHPVTPAAYARIGARVGLPALVAAALVVGVGGPF